MPTSPRIRAELHTHSTSSDGSHSPTALAARVHDAGARVWALTDHDTLDGCAEAQRAALALGLTFITGVELSAQLDRSIHVLGYGVRADDGPLNALLGRLRASRGSRMAQMIARLNALGVSVSLGEVAQIAQDASLTRPHLAQALVQRGDVATIQEAFDRWLGEGRPAHLLNMPLSVPDAIAAIHGAGGVAVLAHPGIYARDHAIPGWLDAGLDGIEVAHPSHSAEDEARYRALASRYGCLITASSDYHGEHVPARKLGMVDLPHEVYRRLCDAIAKRQRAIDQMRAR